MNKFREQIVNRLKFWKVPEVVKDLRIELEYVMSQPEPPDGIIIAYLHGDKCTRFVHTEGLSRSFMQCICSHISTKLENKTREPHKEIKKRQYPYDLWLGFRAEFK